MLTDNDQHNVHTHFKHYFIKSIPFNHGWNIEENIRSIKKHVDLVGDHGS